jgi:spermidine synthase
MGTVDDLEILGRSDGPHGEVLLRRRRRSDGSAVEELVVNGVFAMDSTDTSSERELARFVAAAGGSSPRVLVGGLGLGYTAAAVLDATDPAVGRVDVVELEPQLVAWARDGRTPVLARVAADPRTRLHVGDVAVVLQGAAGPTGPWDAVLLDVDNGPDFLIHQENAALYDRTALAAARDRLSPGGVLAVWCQGPAPDLLAILTALDAAAQEHHVAVEREGRAFSYVVYTLRAADTADDVAPTTLPG